MFRTGSRLAVRHTPDGLVFVLEQLLVRERVDEVFGKVERLIWARSVVLSHVFAQRLRRRRGHPSQIEPHGRSVGAPREPWRTTSISTRRFFGGAVADEDPRSIVAVTSPIAIGKGCCLRAGRPRFFHWPLRDLAGEAPGVVTAAKKSKQFEDLPHGTY